MSVFSPLKENACIFTVDTGRWETRSWVWTARARREWTMMLLSACSSHHRDPSLFRSHKVREHDIGLNGDITWLRSSDLARPWLPGTECSATRKASRKRLIRWLWRQLGTRAAIFWHGFYWRRKEKCSSFADHKWPKHGVLVYNWHETL